MFIGKIELLDMQLDFYVCSGGSAHKTSYIVRFGDQPGEYYSTAEDILDVLLARDKKTTNGHLILALRQWYKDYVRKEKQKKETK